MCGFSASYGQNDLFSLELLLLFQNDKWFQNNNQKKNEARSDEKKLDYHFTFPTYT